jgi:hypothetical protein
VLSRDSHRQGQTDEDSLRVEKNEGFDLEMRVTRVQLGAAGHRDAMLASIESGVKLVDETQENMLKVARLYGKAFQRVTELVEAGKETAKVEEERTHFILEMALGVGIGLSFAEAVPMIEEASHSMELARETAAEAYKLELAGVVKGEYSRAPETALDRFAEGMPALKEAETYRACGELYRSLALASGNLHAISPITDLAADLKADARELEVTGKHRSLTIGQIESRVAALEGAERRLTEARDRVDAVHREIEAGAQASRESAKAALNEPEMLYTMERHLWVHWLASLGPSNADLASEEPIRTELARHGLSDRDADKSAIGWGYGYVETLSDDRAGAKRAAQFEQAMDCVGRTGVLESGRRGPVRAVKRVEGHSEIRDVPGWQGNVRVIPDAYAYWSVQVVGDADQGDEVIITGVVSATDTRYYDDGDARKSPADHPSVYEPFLIALPVKDARQTDPYHLEKEL